jgi:dihydroorotate dehydrogenase (fumarate)
MFVTTEKPPRQKPSAATKEEEGATMPDISTRYMGIELRNPIIIGSSGLTSTAKGVKNLEENGAGAVVLKSIFEEEILYEMQTTFSVKDLVGYQLEQYDLYNYEIRRDNLNLYSKLIKECKKEASIPVIASINCTYSHEWIQYAEQLQTSGADALELNMYFLPMNFVRSTQQLEKTYFEIIKKILDRVSIPISLKISPYFTNLGPMIQKLSKSGISGLVLFNRFYMPDIDIDDFKVVPSSMLSTPDEYLTSLRWIAIMSQKTDCDLLASTGIHDGKTLIKQLLAGAKAVQTVSSLYRNGAGHIQLMLEELKAWMTQHGYENIGQFRGKMSQDKATDSAVFERVQFMKYFGRDAV